LVLAHPAFVALARLVAGALRRFAFGVGPLALDASGICTLLLLHPLLLLDARSVLRFDFRPCRRSFSLRAISIDHAAVGLRIAPLDRGDPRGLVRTSLGVAAERARRRRFDLANRIARHLMTAGVGDRLSAE